MRDRVTEYIWRTAPYRAFTRKEGPFPLSIIWLLNARQVLTSVFHSYEVGVPQNPGKFSITLANKDFIQTKLSDSSNVQ